MPVMVIRYAMIFQQDKGEFVSCLEIGLIQSDLMAYWERQQGAFQSIPYMIWARAFKRLQERYRKPVESGTRFNYSTITFSVSKLASPKDYLNSFQINHYPMPNGCQSTGIWCSMANEHNKTAWYYRYPERHGCQLTACLCRWIGDSFKIVMVFWNRVDAGQRGGLIFVLNLATILLFQGPLILYPILYPVNFSNKKKATF